MLHRHHQQEEAADASGGAQQNAQAPPSGGQGHGHGGDGSGGEQDGHIDGTVMAIAPLPSDGSKSSVRIDIWFEDDHQMVEFRTELPNLYQPDAGSSDAQRIADLRSTQNVKHPGRIPKIQMPITAGCKVPLTYNVAKRKDFVVDMDRLMQRAVRDYVENETRNMARDAARKAVARAAAAPLTGPPWDVPAICPTCGAPVDQAKASKAEDPTCGFCQQPIPATPRARS